jgi:PP-loop superfamily ATP-utilizing enzyme
VRTADLHSRNTDTAARTVHENGFTWSTVRALEQRVTDCSIRHANRCALCKRDAFGQVMQLCRRAQGVVGVKCPCAAALAVLSFAM